MTFRDVICEFFGKIVNDKKFGLKCADLHSNTIVAFSEDYEIAKFKATDTIADQVIWFWFQYNDNTLKYERCNDSWKLIELTDRLSEKQIKRIRTGTAFPWPPVFEQNVI